MRLPSGGRIDRDKPITFTFNGEKYSGLEGDTLASALLANDVKMVARSFKYHRPRGIVGSGIEDPNSLVQLGIGDRTLPNYLATQVELYPGLEATSVNAWPSLNLDFRSINSLMSRFMPPGFYYKTFMWPRWLWPFFERQLRKAGGFGIAPSEADPDIYDKMNSHCDVLVIGAGPAGIAAAIEAGNSGARVILADEQNELGGSLLSSQQKIDGKSSNNWLESSLAELRSMPEVRLLPRSTAFGYYDHNFIAILERVADHLGPTDVNGPRQRLWRIRAKQVILATGAIERPLVFPNNDKPGVMLASAVSNYANRYAVSPGTNAVFFTNNDSAYRAALDLSHAGLNVEAIVDLRHKPHGTLINEATDRGIEILDQHAVTDVIGRNSVKSIGIMRHNETSVFGGTRWMNCDLLAISGGWNPMVSLLSQSGGKLQFDEAMACFVPEQDTEFRYSVGSCKGTLTLAECLSQGYASGAKASSYAGFGSGKKSLPTPTTDDLYEKPSQAYWIVPGRKPVHRANKSFIDMQTDVTAADISIGASEGYRSIEHIKRYTTLGMGTDQGKLSAVNGIGLLSKILGTTVSEIGTTTFRQPYSPVTYGAIAGREIGKLFDPVRKTAIHEWHIEAGAKFENVGQWKRPYYYPNPGESMQEAVDRECLAVRNEVGILDASTLGKIDIKGPDSSLFLNRIYTNGWTRLKIGRCRYGLMLGEDGMVLDDGVTARLNNDHFIMHTTTTGAANVMGWLERWLQTEWPDMKVHLTSVTDHWATMSINGPKARSLISKLCDDADLSNKSFPFMSMREGRVAGIPARIFRISFAGELSYEINVDANYGLHVWKAIIQAGKEFNITPYGTEAMHILRAEKGYVIIGQDTDGSMTPIDIGLERMVSNSKDFLGKRSLSRSAMSQSDRKQLVGLVTMDQVDEPIPEGGQVVIDPSTPTPIPMLGHVTSSYQSANLGHPIALAIISNGRARNGDQVYVSLADGRSLRATVSSPIFFDLAGDRQNVE